MYLFFSLFQTFSSLFSSLFFLSFLIYVIMLILSSLFSLLSSPFFFCSSLQSFQRRGGFRVANWDPPPPAWQGSRACEIGVRFHQSLSSEGPRAFRRPRRPGHVLATGWPVPVGQNAILEPLMASKMPSWTLRWPSDHKIMQKSTKFSKLMLKISQIMLIYAKFRLQKDSYFIGRVSKFKLFAVLWSRQPSGLENC